MSLLEHCEHIISVTSIEELWRIHTEKMAEYGFDRLIYGFTRFRTAHSFGNREDFLILTNHEPAYVEKFVNDGLYFHAPMVRWAAENTGACSWRWMEENIEALTESERKVVAFNRSMEVTAGYSISFRDASIRSKGAIALTGRRGLAQDDLDEVWAEHGRDIVVMNNLAHLRIINLPYTVAGKQLTRRQKEALEWVGDGKTMQDIATIMGLTIATIEKHLRLAREALAVETTAQAVLKASFQNQIFVFEN